jgi:hypothetical protein
MVLITIDKKYEFPTQLNEITLRQFIAISEKINEKDYDNIVFDLIPVPEEVFFNISLEGRFKIIQLIEILMDGEFLHDQKDIDLNLLIDCPIGQFEDWKAMIMQQTNKPWNALQYLCLLEKGEYNYDTRIKDRINVWLDMPASVALFYQNIINQEFEDIKNKFIPLFENEVEDIQLEAGIQTLQQFGGYLTLVNLAGGVYKDIEMVSKTTVGEAYTFLTYKQIERQYEKNLQKLLSEKSNRNIQD